MAKFVRLQTPAGTEVWVNIDLVRSVRAVPTGSQIIFERGSEDEKDIIGVAQAPSDVVRLFNQT